MKLRFKMPILIGFFVFLLSFLIYIYGLPPTLLGGDAGDLLAAIVARTNAHPSGYPLYVLLGILFSFLPFSATLAYKVSLLSALFGSLSVLLFFYFTRLQTKSLIVSTVSALTLAFTYPFWLYAETTEVFSLHYLFVVLLFLLSYLYAIRRKVNYLYFLSFFLGLSLTNNLSVILVFPSLFVLLISNKFLKQLTIPVVLKCLGLFLIGLTPYVYLFFANDDPLMRWGNINDIGSFLHHALRLHYGWGVESQSNLKIENRLLALLSFATYWRYTLPPVMLVTMCVGVVFLFKENKRLFLSLIIGFFFSGILYVFYGANPLSDPIVLGVLERFYVVPYIFVLPFFAFGIVGVRNTLLFLIGKRLHDLSKRNILRYGLLIPFLIVPVFLFFHNMRMTDFRNIWIAEDFARDLLLTIPKNSIVFFHGDNSSFGVAYLQLATYFRMDVLHGSKSAAEYLARSDKVYRDTLREIRGKKSEKFTQDDEYLSMLFRNQNIHPVFSEGKIGAGLHDVSESWVPYGLLFRLRTPGESLSKEAFLKQQEQLVEQYHISEIRKSVREQRLPYLMYDIPESYVNAFINIGTYLNTRYHDPVAAQIYFIKALQINPYHKTALINLIDMYLLLGQCDKAKFYVDRLSGIDRNRAKIFQKILREQVICQKSTAQEL